MNILMLGESQSIHQQRIARAMAARGHRVIFAGFSAAPVEGIEVIDLRDETAGLPGLRFLRKVRRLRNLVRARRIDVLHAHYITVYGLLASLAGPVPKLLSVHGSDVLLARQKRYNRIVIRIVARSFDRITSASPQLTAALETLGAPAGRIETFQYGVDVTRFCPRELSPAAGRPMRIISTRRLEPLYGVDLLLMALSRMACGERFEARIAGDGSEAGRLRQLAWSLQLDDEVRFLGALDEPGVAAALQQAEVYVSTAPTDGASLSLLEAMAAGLVPVAADIPANRAWIRPGENGLLFMPGRSDALAATLLEAAHNGALREKARVLNPEIVRKRANFNDGIQRLATLYEKLVEQRGEGRT